MGSGVHFGLQNEAQMSPKWCPKRWSIQQSRKCDFYNPSRMCPNGSTNGSKFDPKSSKKVMSKRTPPKDHHFEIPGRPEEGKGPKKLPKEIPQGPPETPQTCQNGFQKRAPGGSSELRSVNLGVFWINFLYLLCSNLTSFFH